jgi:hypothetical protein
MMHRNHLTNTLTYENYCLKAKIQELLEKIAHLQARLLACREGRHHSRGDEPLSESQLTTPIAWQEEINKKNIEIEYLKEQIEALSQKYDIVASNEASNELEPEAAAAVSNELIASNELVASNEPEAAASNTGTDKVDITFDSQILALQETIIDLKNQLQTKTLQLELSHETIVKMMAEVDIVKRMALLKESENEHLKTIIAGKDAEIAHLKMTIPQP